MVAYGDKKHCLQWAGLALAMLVLSGCAGVTPQKSDEPAYQTRTVKEANGFTLAEDVRLSEEARADFEAAMKALEADDLENGIALLEKVTAAAPNATAPFVNLAIAYGKASKLERAEEALKQAIRLNPDHPVANNEFGILYRKTGRFQEARTAYEKVLEKYPEFLPVRKNLGVLCDLYLRDYECALENYQAYSTSTPDDKNMTIWIADVQRRLGK